MIRRLFFTERLSIEEIAERLGFFGGHEGVTP